jgi:hypothetical protein
MPACNHIGAVHNYWDFGLFPLSGVLGTIKHDVFETASVSVLRCGGKTPTQLGLLDRANLLHCVFCGWFVPRGYKRIREQKFSSFVGRRYPREVRSRRRIRSQPVKT